MVNSAEDVVVNPVGFIIAQMVVMSVKIFHLIKGWSGSLAHQMPIV